METNKTGCCREVKQAVVEMCPLLGVPLYSPPPHPTPNHKKKSKKKNQEFDISFVSLGDNLQEMPNSIFWENKVKGTSSADILPSMLKTKLKAKAKKTCLIP